MSALTNALPAARLTQSLIVGLAVIAVAVADICLKQATARNDLGQAMRSPWLWGAVGLYLLQIVFFTYAFTSGWQLSALGAWQTALYAIVVLAAGVIFYRETLTPAQALGLVLALGGVTLINWR